MAVTSPEASPSFARFLGADDEAALGEAYTTVRRKLIRLFVCRGCRDAEELADETITRVMLKCDAIVDSYVGDPLLYFYGVARKVLLESVKAPPTAPPMPEPDPPELKEAMQECLDHCLQATLKEDERQLILEYYKGEKGSKIAGRKQLAALLGQTTNWLRIKVHRIRATLRPCIASCLEQKGLK